VEKPNIYITRKIADELLKPYKEKFNFRIWSSENRPVPRETLLEEVKRADGLLCMLTEKVDDNILQHAPWLKIVANLAVGYDNIDVHAATKRNIIVTNTPDVLTETTADLAFALLLATARRLVEANHFIQNDQWEHWSPFLLAGADVHHQTIGIVGMGRIGEAVARRANGFGMSILYHNRSRKRDVEEDLQATYTSFDELWSKSDFVVSLFPLPEETEPLFNASTFGQMKSSAIFINVSRGQTVDGNALFKALQRGDIAAAGLDVFKNEPIASDHPLMQLENIVCLPHIGSASVATRKKMIDLCLRNLEYHFAGHDVLTPVK